MEYAKIFSKLAKVHDSVQTKDFTGYKALKQEAKYSKKTKIEQYDAPYIDFTISKQVMENHGGKWMAFPKIQKGKVVSIIIAYVNPEATHVGYKDMADFTEFYRDFAPAFQKAFEDKQQRLKSAQSSSTRKTGEGEYTDIEEVIITKYTSIDWNQYFTFLQNFQHYNAYNFWNSCNAEGVDMMCQIYGACDYTGGSGGGGSYSAEISNLAIEEHIDPSKLKENPCVESVYNKLKSKSNLFKNLLGNFKGKSIVNLNFEFKNIVINDAPILGQTDLNRLYYYGQATITLNPNLMGSSDILIASVLIHEMLHAKFVYDLIKVGWDGNKYKDIANIDEKKLPTLLQDYYKYNYDADFADHNHIANWYVGYIADALGNYDNNQHSRLFYERMAWSGLSQSSAYGNKTIDEQKAIYDVYTSNIKNEPCKK